VKFGSPAEVERNLAAIMNELNQQIYLNSPAEKYATLFWGRYVAAERLLCYSNAGHLPPIVLNGDSVRRLETGGTVLGLFDGIEYEAQTVELPPGSLISLFTDGITEAVNVKDEEFGEKRLLNALREFRTLPPEIIFRRVVGRVQEWQGTLKQQDDITLIVGKVD
jgi:sigma-B regulation protein RsbU (phosphoserine phosphatase)